MYQVNVVCIGAVGNWLLPLIEVVTIDKEVVASSKEVRSIAVHTAEVACAEIALN